MKDRDKIVLIAAAAVGVLLYRTIASAATQLFALFQFISPASVSDIAAQLPAGEDEFIIAAWEQVGNDITYDGYASEITIMDHTVECARCLLATEVLNAGRANCVGKAILLTSLLRNRLPADRVYMAIGQLSMDGVGGHAWVVVQRAGSWYLLESTRPPNGWQLVASRPEYILEALLNDQDVICTSSSLCLSVKKASCDCMLKYAYGY